METPPVEPTRPVAAPAQDDGGLWKNPLLRRMLGENFRMQWRRYVVAVIAMVIVAAMTAATAYIMRHIIDTMTQAQDRTQIFLVAAAVAGIFTLKGVATYLQMVKLSRAGLQIVADLQSRVYHKLLRQGLGFFNTSESSALITQITQGAMSARMMTELILTSYVRDLLTVIFLVGVMFYQQPFLSAVVLVAGPLAALGMRKLLSLARDMANAEMASLSEIIKVIQETAAGIRIIKAFSMEKPMAQRMDKAIVEVEKRAYTFFRIQAIVSPLVDTLSGLAIAVVVALSAVNFLGLENTTPGALMSFITALLMAYEPAKRLLRTRIQIDHSLRIVGFIYALLDAPETVPVNPDATEMPPGEGVIDFDNVTIAFNGRPVLRGLTHRFEARKTTALVGPSGGGKSTIMNLILRMYDPTEGRVLIDGMDISHATPESLRRKMAFVSQDTFLFSDSVLENLRVGRPDAPDADLFEAARLAHAHEFISELKWGYLTPIGENGAMLSGGQKQRLAIARAIVRRAPILLLDEATSALDSNSEQFVQEALETITTGVTTIVIAHRLSTILNADSICYVEDGRIIESGPLAELLAKPDGAFRALYDKQFRHSATTDADRTDATVAPVTAEDAGAA
ncbi:MAG: hypothetical protein RIR62_1807 [Pseudomonadota bacterium]